MNWIVEKSRRLLAEVASRFRPGAHEEYLVEEVNFDAPSSRPVQGIDLKLDRSQRTGPQGTFGPRLIESLQKR